MATAQAGDGVAYDALLRELLPMLRGMARRRLADPAEAEDAVQDTLLTFHRLRCAYDPTRPIRPWLAAICERRCLDRLRRRMRETSFEAFADRLGAPRVDSSLSSSRRSAAVRGCQMR
jgi:RNA polymerase sigma-70 factor (ECF subfamily)